MLKLLAFVFYFFDTFLAPVLEYFEPTKFASLASLEGDAFEVVEPLRSLMALL